ncbi:toll-like receptor 13 isoform X1 [Oreochromis niloticus]|uniref:Toll-like receptor 13 n=1 Tax=Oreochromis niloticus TaxID=8128 RepID=A0A669BT56_ORENI|nr:toll-like receptor 13 isoform X1 [Oreochromis niloticus]
MLATGVWPLLLLSLLSCFFHCEHLLAFSLKNCTIIYTEKSNVSVTCTERYLAAIPDDIPKNAVLLNLKSNYISNITRMDLEGLFELEVLNLEKNWISQIDDDAFADLVELKVLILSINRLAKLTKNMFQGLSKLETLSLDWNQISFISPVAFQPLVGVHSVDLSYNLLHQITDIDQIIKLPTSQHLFVCYNNFTSFQSDDLHVNTSNLLTLSLDSVKKFSITRDIFPHLQSLDLRAWTGDIEWEVSNKTFLKSLTRLQMSGTSLSFEVYRAILQTVYSLQELQMDNIKKWIDDGLIDVACQIHSLKTLNVSSSKIHTLKENMLQSCSHLTNLNLSSNHIESVADNALQSMTQLRSLILQNNYLSELPVAVQGLTTLEVYDLSINDISELYCPYFWNLTSLTILDLSHNRISYIYECVFENLNNLKILNLENNKISSFDYSFKFKLQTLDFLYLKNNELINLFQGVFSNLSSLRYLSLDVHMCNNVEEGGLKGLHNLQFLLMQGDIYFYEHFSGLPNLSTLILNVVSSLPHNSSEQRDKPFSNLPKLRKLHIKVHKGYYDISKDVLSGLTSLESLRTEAYFMGSLHPDTFKHTPQLKRVTITYSELSVLTSDVFLPIPNLMMLDLSNNKLRSLDFLAEAKLPALRWLDVSNNELFVISETVIQSLLTMKYLDLSANLLTCECSNYGLIHWIQSSKQTQVVNAHQYTCAFPVSQRGNKFLDFGFDSCWIDAALLCFLFSSSLVVLTLLASFIYHFLRSHLTYAYYLFLAFLYDNKRRKKGIPHSYDAFVSYNVRDEAWVCGELLPELEGQQGWRLCLHHRDFEPGKPIVENITEAIYSSRKTICVISQHYLQSEWCSKEIQMASFRLFNEHKDVLIMVFLEHIPAKQLSPYYQIRSLVKKRSYLSWPQAVQHTGVFWQKIQQALSREETPAEHRRLLTGHQRVIQ